ncbi:MAG: class I poly(R)-hydroxyalkanoic acid synthase [Parvularculaceae bacterium]|nr:class I poly(R)-hydroxyalkanoic acid synthase [Parvularculaceae bacterium]
MQAERKPAPAKKKASPRAGSAPKAPPHAEAKEPASAQSAPAGAGQRSLIEDFDALSEYLVEITGKSQEVIKDFFTKTPSGLKMTGGETTADPLNVGEAFQEMMRGLAADPGTVLQRQFQLWGDYAKMMANLSRKMAGEAAPPAIEPEPGDKRFVHPAWRENPMLDFVKQSYLTYAKWLKGTVAQLDHMDEHEKRRAEFYTQQFLDAIAPSNFPVLNPEVVEATLESKGENILKGIRNLLEDLDRGDGQLSIRQADLDFFKLGENVATTPGKVVFQNPIFQLIQYDPVTDEVAKRPLLIFPPWINKFYILDLQPSNSFIKWMVEQGRTVFVVSWVNPGPELAHKSFQDYIHEGLYEALDAVKQATGEAEVDAIGYCIGGTMLATALALMAKRKDKRIRSATFFTAQADFAEAGDLLLFVDDAQLEAIAKQMDAAGGVLEGRAMANTFNMLRSNDLIWQFVIDNYMKGKDPARFDLLFWNSDATRMPKNVHLFYLREFYKNNALAKGEMIIDGERLDLGDVDIPIFMQAGETDHIAPHNSVYRTAKLFASKGNDKVLYMLAGSGHIAGVVNHPAKKKYHHSINEALPASLDEWKAKASRHPGSWWPYWIEWLNKVSPGKVPARRPGDGALPVIEDAPGSYVKVKA